MKTRSIEFDHDLVYGRDVRLAGIAALVLVMVAFLLVPQPQVAPYRMRAPVVLNLTTDEPLPVIYDPPKAAVQIPRGVVQASNNPDVVTIDPNTDFNELYVDVAAPTIDNVPFWKVERKPTLVREAVPDYPEIARAAGIEGKVVVAMVVDTLGRVARAEVFVSSGNTLLDQAAVDAAYRCAFTPGYQRDRPVVVRNVMLPFQYKLQ